MKKFPLALLGAVLLFACDSDDDGDSEGQIDESGDASGDPDADASTGTDAGRDTADSQTTQGGTTSGGGTTTTTDSGGDETSSTGGAEDSSSEEETGDVDERGEIDRDALKRGVEVKLDGRFGSVVVPLLGPVKPPTKGAVPDVVGTVVNFTLKSNDSGVTVNLTEGQLVERILKHGQYTLKLTEDNKGIAVLFYNLTNAGLSLTPGVNYTGVLTIGENELLHAVPTTVVPVTVR